MFSLIRSVRLQPDLRYLRCSTNGVRTDYPRHLPAFDYRGPHRYFLSFCTADRHFAFAEAAAVYLVRGQFLRAADRHLFAVLAYCFMPDHLHLLVEGLLEES